MKKLLPIVTFLTFVAEPAIAHVGQGPTVSLAAGFVHPFSGFDHVIVMLTVGLWAAQKGGRALWAWPAVFVGVMLFGGVLAMHGTPLPFVEPAILASVVALGLLVALAVDLPIGAGAAVITVFALFHGYAHGSEVTETVSGIAYMAGFALATAALHVLGIGFAKVMMHLKLQSAVRVAGLLSALVGVGLFAGAI
jgi:urease accessory protein